MRGLIIAIADQSHFSH